MHTVRQYSPQTTHAIETNREHGTARETVSNRFRRFDSPEEMHTSVCVWIQSLTQLCSDQYQPQMKPHVALAMTEE
jgi:hypothetical protein